MEVSKLSNNWLDLGQLTEKNISLKDSMIPENKREFNCSEQSKLNYWLNINGQVCYFKTRTKRREIINEALGEVVSKYFKLPTVENNLACGETHVGEEVKKVYGLLSIWARKPNVTYSYFENDFKDAKTSGIETLNFLEKNFEGQPIVKDFTRFLAREYFSHEIDRVNNPILLAKENDSLSMGFLYDYEYQFGTCSYSNSPYLLNLQNEEHQKFILSHPTLRKEFKKILHINLLLLLEYQFKLKLKEEEKERISSYELKKQEEVRRTLSL